METYALLSTVCPWNNRCQSKGSGVQLPSVSARVRFIDASMWRRQRFPMRFHRHPRPRSRRMTVHPPPPPLSDDTPPRSGNVDRSQSYFHTVALFR